MLAERKDGFSPNMEEAPNIIVAGVGYTIAAAILMAYRENTNHEHVGRIAVCQGAWPLTLIGICLGLFTIAASALSYVLMCVFGGPRAPLSDSLDDQPFSYSKAFVGILYWVACLVVAGGFWVCLFPLVVIQFLLREFVNLFRCVRAQRVSPQDAVWLQESVAAPMIIHAVLIFEQPLDIERIKVLYEQRLGGDPKYERMKSRVVQRGGQFYWLKDPHFDLNKHVLQVQGWQKPDTEEELLKFVGNLAGQPLSSKAPLWQFLVVNGYEGNKSVGIWRCHHVLADGNATHIHSFFF